MAEKPTPLSRSISPKALSPSNSEAKKFKGPGAQQASFATRVKRAASSGSFNPYITKQAIHSDSGNDLKNSFYEAYCTMNQLAILGYAHKKPEMFGNLSIDLHSILSDEQYKERLHNGGQKMTAEDISTFIQDLIGNTQSKQ